MIDGLEAFRRNSLGFFQDLPDYMPDARAWTDDRLFIGISGWNLFSFNNAFVLDEHDLQTTDLVRVKAIFQEQALPYSIIAFSRDPVPACDKLMQDSGYMTLYTDPVLSQQGPIKVGSHFPLEVRPVITAEERTHFREVLAEAFEMPPEFGIDVFEQLIDIPLNRPYLGWAEGAAVASGMLLLCGGVAAIFNVATRTTLRRRGIGTAMIAALHDQALAAGYDSTVLLSTPIGLSLYLKLGYELNGYQITYVPAEYR